MAIRVGRWDCNACGHKGKLGPKTKCEKCAAGRPANVKFYLSSNAEIVTDKEKIKEAKAGTETRTRYVEVKVGEEEYVCGQKDLGNGYFEDEYCTRDIYETQTETYEVDVYKDVPVYETEYTYYIWRWKIDKPITTKGNHEELYWGQVPISDKIRSTDSSGIYVIFILDHKEKEQEEDVEFKFWNSVKINDMIKAKKSKLFNFYIGLVED